MKKLLILAICAMTLIVGCKNKGQNAASPGADTDSVASTDTIVAVDVDTVPMPMFLYTHDKNHMQVVYWTNPKEPTEEDAGEVELSQIHEVWALQEMLRRNAAKYTKLIRNGQPLLDIKFIGEVLTNPDGEQMTLGEIHGRVEIPSPGACFSLADPKLFPSDMGGIDVIVCDEYLSSRKQLQVDDAQPDNEGRLKPMPQQVVSQMEQTYGMKAARSMVTNVIEGDYQYGIIQFEGEYKNAPKLPGEDNITILKALALEVLVKGDKAYPIERIGYYYPGEGPTWNADDDGEYLPSFICAAFEGPRGLELCYMHGAPESITTGMLFLRDDKLQERKYACYHTLIDEELPVWKKDVVEMQKLYQAYVPQQNKDVRLAKWAHVYLDYDNEWIWMRDEAEKNGAFFIRKDGKFTLIAVETIDGVTTTEQGQAYEDKLSKAKDSPVYFKKVGE